MAFEKLKLILSTALSITFMQCCKTVLMFYNGTKNIESMDKKKQIIELIERNNWHNIPVKNTVEEIFSILGVVEQSELLPKIKDGECCLCGDVAKSGWVCEDCKRI